jgi:hypothetical protein
VEVRVLDVLRMFKCSLSPARALFARRTRVCSTALSIEPSHLYLVCIVVLLSTRCVNTVMLYFCVTNFRTTLI